MHTAYYLRITYCFPFLINTSNMMITPYLSYVCTLRLPKMIFIVLHILLKPMYVKVLIKKLPTRFPHELFFLSVFLHLVIDTTYFRISINRTSKLELDW